MITYNISGPSGEGAGTQAISLCNNLLDEHPTNIVLLLDLKMEFVGLARDGKIKNAQVLTVASYTPSLSEQAKQLPSNCYVIARSLLPESEFLTRAMQFAYEMEKHLFDSHTSLARVYLVCKSEGISSSILQNYYTAVKSGEDVSVAELISARSQVDAMYWKVYYAEQIAQDSQRRECAAIRRAEKAEEVLQLYKAQPWWRRVFLPKGIED